MITSGENHVFTNEERKTLSKFESSLKKKFDFSVDICIFTLCSIPPPLVEVETWGYECKDQKLLQKYAEETFPSGKWWWSWMGFYVDYPTLKQMVDSGTF